MKWRSICSVTSKSAMTPSFSGRIAEIEPGVRPSIRFASTPTACTSPVRWSIATTDGSERTIPRPRTYTSVFAVPRSTAMSRPPKPVIERKRPIGRLSVPPTGFAAIFGRAGLYGMRRSGSSRSSVVRRSAAGSPTTFA